MGKTKSPLRFKHAVGDPTVYQTSRTKIHLSFREAFFPSGGGAGLDCIYGSSVGGDHAKLGGEDSRQSSVVNAAEEDENGGNGAVHLGKVTIRSEDDIFRVKERKY